MNCSKCIIAFCFQLHNSVERFFNSLHLEGRYMVQVKNLLALTLGVSLLAACSSAPIAPVATQQPVVAQASAPASMAPAVSRVEPVVIPPYLDPNSALSKSRSVYFDYDGFAIKPEYSQMLEVHGRYLAANPKTSIRVEGSADERGSAEYNLALGQKRAETVVRALKVYGVKDLQMEAISWGEEKPKAMGHDESAYAQNRRADLAYPTK